MDLLVFTKTLPGRFVPVLLVFCLLAACAASQPRPESGEGQAEAAALFAEGVKAFNRSDMKKSRDLLGRYLEVAPGGDYAPNALLTLGKIDLYQRQYDEAQRHFNSVARRWPDSPYETEARQLLQVLAVERQRDGSRRASHAESPVMAEIPADPVAPSQALSRHADYRLALQTFLAADASRHSGAARDLMRVVDRMTIPDLEQALREAPTGSYEQGLLSYRLGAYTMHLRNWNQAEAHFRRVLTENPGHELAPRAAAGLERLRQRREVAPTRIGVLLPPDKGRLSLVRGALRMAAEEARGDSGGELEFVFMETRGEAIAAAEAVDTLVTRHQVIAIVGGLIGDEAEAAAYRAEQFDVPLVTLSPRPGLTEIGKHVFRVALTPHMQAKAIVDYAWDIKGFRTFAILYPMHPYGRTLAMAFWDEVTRREGHIVGVERYRHDETTFRPYIRTLVGRYDLSFSDNAQACRSGESMDCGRVSVVQKDDTQPKVGFDAIFIPDYARQVSFIAPAIAAEDVEIDNGLVSTYGRIARTERRFGVKVPMVHLLGGNGWNSPRLHEFGGRYVAGSLFVDGFFVDETSDTNVTGFIARFSEAHNEPPAAQEAYAYDAVRLVGDVLVRQRPQSRETLLEALAGLASRPYTGLTGAMHFDASGDLVSELTVLTLQEGRIVPASRQVDLVDDTAPKPEG